MKLLDARARRRLWRDGSAMFGFAIVSALVIFAVAGPWFISHHPNLSDLSAVRGPAGAPPGPSPAHLLGTDPLHRDLLARLAHGARLSLTIASASTLVALLVGTAIGVTAGWFEGTRLSRIDAALMRLVDVALAFPYLLLVTAIGVALDRADAATVVVILGLTAWTGIARVTRAKTLEIKRRDYLMAARALGARWPRLVRQVLVGLRPTLLVVGSHAIAQLILAEAVLSYLTVGIAAPEATWGRMLHEAEHYLGVQPLLVAAPGTAIVLSVVGFTRVGDGLRDALDPRLILPGRGWLRVAVDAVVVGGTVLLVGLADPEALSAPEPAPADAGPRQGGALRLASTAPVHGLDPALAYDEASRIVGDHLYARLLTWDDEGKLVGDLCASYETLDGGRRYRCQLREGLRFHDGSPLSASDVKRSLERLLHPRTPSPGAHLYRDLTGFQAFHDGKAETLAGVVVTGPHTVELVLDNPNAAFLSLLTMGFAAPVCSSMGAQADPKSPAAPCGAGPFRLASLVAGERLSLERFDSWYEPGKPYLDGIEWTLGVPSRTQRYRFEAAQSDLVVELTGIDSARFALDERWARHRAWLVKPATHGIFLNTELAPFDDVHMRRAVAFGVDPSVLPAMHPSVASASRVLPPSIPGPARDHPMRVHDLERALAEMKRAGYPFDPATGEGGYPEPIDYVTVVDTFEQSSAEIFQQQLARIGIVLRLKLVSWPAWMALVSTRGAAAIGLRGWQADYPDPSTFFEPILGSEAIADRGSQNVSFFASPELDSVLSLARREPDVWRRMALFQKAEAIVQAEAPWVPVYHSRVLHLWQPYVKGYRPHPVEPLRLRNLWLEERP
jgi:ABC-type dipeptide/oligopeptide/nickel transport system permease subunit/ABC-type transport system substrate-binding protein